MNKTQRGNTAKYFYDLSKITFTLAVLGNLLAKERFDWLTFLFGVIFAISSFVFAFLLDKKEG